MKKHKSKANIERLRGTLEAIKADIAHFHQAFWVSPPNSEKWPETCGDFSWFAVNKYGTQEQKDKFTWDGFHEWVGHDLLGLSPSEARLLFWGGNDLEKIEKAIDKLELEQ